MVHSLDFDIENKLAPIHFGLENLFQFVHLIKPDLEGETGEGVSAFEGASNQLDAFGEIAGFGVL